MKRVLSAAVVLILVTHGLSAQDAHRRAQQVLAASQPPPVATASATDAEIRTALGLAPSTTISRVGDPAAFGVFSNLGVISPVVGTQFLAMSTGVAGTQSPQPGVDYGPFGESGDQATVAIGLQVPPGVTKLSFSYRFLSAEFPEYVGTIYNDTITVHVTQNGVTSEVARSNVNSAAFFPASQSNAGGSGYDIVDGFGQPDAGLTNWLPVTVPVTGGTNVTVQFLIADVGDGIYDSQVLISRFALGALEIVDPNPDLRASNPTFITTDIDKLAERGTIRRGAAADGVSRLLLRATPSGGSTVRFHLIDSAGSQDGALIPIGGGTPTTDLQVPVVNTIKGPRAFAIYLAPENFEKAGYENAGERPVNLRVTSGVGGTEVTDTQLIVARPPVLFVHGVWSGENLAPYGSQVLLTDPRFIGRTYVPSYQSTNASHFSTNIPRYKDWSQTVLKQLRDGGIAATQVDVVAHSMGGLLARAYANSGGYLRADNYQQGDFNRVISLNSPHSGSPLANILMDFDANPIFGGLFRWAAEQIGKPVHLGAIEDLQEGSTAITGIGTASVQGHAVGGTGGSDILETVGAVGTIADLAAYIVVEPTTKAVLETVAFVADLLGAANTIVFGNREHDAIVPLDSELGGMPAAASDTRGGLDSLHFTVGSSSDYSTVLSSLLMTNATTPAFAPFPAAGGNGQRVGNLPARTPQQTTSVVPPQGLTLSFTGPSTVVSGGSVGVSATVNAPHVVTSVLFVGPGFSQVDSSAPFGVTVPIPLAALGAFPISAAAASNGSPIISNTVTAQVSAPAALQGVQVDPADVLITGLGNTLQLTVQGAYADSVERNLAGQPSLVMSSSNTAVATVNSSGVITAHGLGYATITATHGVFTDSISVTVNPYFGEPAPTANAGPDQAVTAFTPVTLPGSASGVPAGLTPSYEWSQTSGPVVILNGTTSQNASFTPLANGTYVFSLVVRAGLSESTPDNVTVLVGSVSAPTISSHPVNQSASTGDSAAFSVGATGVPTPTYQWQVSTQASGPWTNLSNAPPYSGVNTPVLSVTSITSTLNNTHYRAIATNSAGSATSNAATLTVTAAALTELVHNGTFSSGMTGWLQFATPDLSYIVSNVTGGVLQFYRVPPPPGTANQAVVFQETATALNAGAPVTAKFDLGNSSSARLRITVLVLESNFSDLSVCTFWLPPNTPLQPYVMRTHTTRSWINASIYFYAATAGNHGGFYQVDNVSLQYTPAESPASTECVDPLAPSAPGGPDGPTLLVNGNFDTGSLAPWQVFGQIVSQLTGGVFEFYRAAGTPSGVVFQNTGQPVSASEILTATFQLGNSSSVRKRVTVLLHASDFSDLSACTFWLAPGQPLSNYAYRTYATQAWSSAMLSVYPATVGTEQWIRLDNATLQRTPSAEIVGTECLEPGALSNAITERAAMTSMSADGRGQSATIPIGGVDTGPVAIGGEDSRASATFELDGSRLAPVINGGPSRLAFRSLLIGTSSRGLIQVSAGDGVWITVGLVGPSDDWEDIEIDLRELIGSAVEIRFVIEHLDRDGLPELWLIDRVRMAAGERPPL